MDQKKGQTNEDRYNFDYFDKMNQKEAQKRETKVRGVVSYVLLILPGVNSG